MQASLILLPLLAAASPAWAQERGNIPSGSPLGEAPTTAAAPQMEIEAQRARVQAAARARANAQAMAEAFAPAAPPATIDEGRASTATSTFGQPGETTSADARAAASPYGGYYRIRTPWDRR